MQPEFEKREIFHNTSGNLLHYFKENKIKKNNISECYFSWINPGYIKGWYRHKEFTSYMTSPTQNLQIVLFDEKNQQPIKIFKICEGNYGVLKIEKGIWYAVKSSNNSPALIVNSLNKLYDPNEVEKLPLTSSIIPYSWE